MTTDAATAGAPIVLRLEAIGDHLVSRLRAQRRGKTRLPMHDRNLLQAMSLEARQPWVREIVGVAVDGSLQHRWLRGQKSYAEANGIGSRGIFLYFHLEYGKVYEINDPQTWTRCERYLCRHAGEELERVARDEVVRWLR